MSRLSVRCHEHKKNSGSRKPLSNCGSCWLIYVMAHQFGKDPDSYLGSLNPYTYLIADVDLEDACSGIEISQTR